MDKDQVLPPAKLNEDGTISALAVFRDGKTHGVILRDDVVDFLNSMFTQPDGARITLVRANVDPKLIGAPVTKRPTSASSKIDSLVGKNG